jgi:hypothetical protein
MKTIYKYPIAKNQMIPMTAKILRVGLQNGTPFLWAELDPGHTVATPRHFEIFGTGHSIPDKAEYVGGYSEQPFEWHVYEVFS